ncbi:MAG: hypothetical protein JO090_13040 [Rhizobacter sp.]|nr:hypothetical protein [Rhizobacter sp.]
MDALSRAAPLPSSHRHPGCAESLARLLLFFGMAPTELLVTPTITELGLDLLESHDEALDRLGRSLLLSIDGRRDRRQLESVARSLGLRADALDRLCEAGLVKFVVKRVSGFTAV